MKARVESARKSFQARTRLAFALVGIVLAALLVVGLTSAANPSQVGVFELDGNGVADGTAADWNCLYVTPLPAKCPASPQPTAKTPVVTDKVSDTTDDILGKGSKDTLDTDQWALVSQQAPPKSDLADAVWANYNVPVAGDQTNPNHDIVYFAADRASNNGDAFLGFWFFKSKISENADGSFSGLHSVGDTLVLVNFVQGQGSAKISGGTQSIGVFEWVGTQGDINGGTLKTIVPVTQAQCVGSPLTLQACGQFNTDNQPSVWPFQSIDSGDPANIWTPSEFAEGGIDLTSLFPDGTPCFTSVMAETRSSDSPTAEQKDVILGSLNNCGTVKIVKDAQPDGAQSFGYTSDLAGASTFSLTDDGTSANTNEVDNVKPGTYTVTENANPTGWNLSAVSCDDANSTGSVPDRKATIVVDPSETVTCTFTNQKQPTLTVNKVCNPANDAGKFNLQIDGSTAGTGANAACGGTTGAVPETIALHTVGETAGTGADLANYTSVISGDCGTDGKITLAPGQNAVCTVTNSRKATLTVNKVCVPANDTGKFTLQVDGTTAKADATCGTGTGAQVVSAASHTVGEVAGTGTDLSNYTSVIGGACAADGTITLAAGDNKTCTITNTRKPTLTVNKVCVPANDTGKFNLQIDSQTAKADATCGTGTGAVVTTVGSHTVGETAGTGNDLGAYTAVIGGDCTANGSITLAAGQNAVCTITNTHKSTLTVNKVCNPTTDSGKFTLQIDGATAKADAACGTGTGPVVTTVGSHSVSETAGTGTSLSNYTSVISGDCAANGSVTVSAGQNAVCTITNTRKPTLTVNKVCNPTTDTGKFNLQIDGATSKADAACGTGTGAVVSSVGNHTIGETYGTGTSSSNYFAPVFGGDCSETGTITLAAGQNAVCTITNNRKGAIAITKTPATQAVDSGGTATFTITVTNTGPVTLTNVTVTDPLSTSCAKTIGTLTAGQVSTYSCTQPNVTAAFTNTATVTGHPPFGPDLTASASANVTINPPPSSPPAPTPPAPAPTVVDLAIVKTAAPTSMTKGANVTYTLTVTNNGPVTDTAVQVADSLPFGVTYVSATSSQGTCSGTAVVQCSIGTMTNGQKVTITIVGTTTTTGTIVNTTTVVGALPETTLTNNTSSASITVAAPPAPKPAPKPFKPPVVKPKPKPVPPPCYAVVVAPKTLTVGKNGHLQLRVSAKNKAIAGVKVEIKGAGILKLSGRTDSAGKVTLVVHPKKAGMVLVKPASYKGCANPRIGVIGAFTPPVTG